MSQVTRRKAMAFVALAGAAVGGAEAWRPRVRLADGKARIELETLFPKQFDGWSTDTRMPVQLVSPDTQALLDKIYNQVLSRTYVSAKGERIMLSVAYGGDQSDATRAHRPEVCYPAQGFSVHSQTRAVLALGDAQLPVRRLVAVQGARIEPITYWIVVGERVATSGTEQKLAQLSYGAKGLVADGMLVRVSSIDAQSQHAFALQEAFLADLTAALSPSQRTRVVGGTA